MTTDPNRPYPEGLSWDEAWRQRQKADRLEKELENTRNLLRSVYGSVMAGWNFSEGLLRKIEAEIEPK